MNDTSDKYANFSHDELVAEINRLKKHKKYGLVWEHKTEKVIEDFETQQPYLEEVTDKRIEDAPGEPTNLIIEGDNFEALSILNYTHAGKVDVIYIDPPYNTGNKDFIYNDNYVDSEDEFRHSKWLSFMEPRLKLAKNLLKDDGVIFISIDDIEYSALKSLCDEVFGINNFISNIIWYKNNSKGNVNSISIVTEYVICYCKNRATLPNFEIKKQNAVEMCNVAKEIFEKNNRNIEKTNKEFRMRLKEHDITAGEKKYNRVDENGRLYTDKPLTAPGSKLFYEIIHPITKKPCKYASRGWAYKKESFLELLESGHILFGKDETTCPYLKYYLDENLKSVPTSHIQLTANNSVDLQLLGFKKEVFNYPKPVKLINELLSMIDKKKSVILDFFAGSGTTGQAVLELNKEDGGHRQFILCTNNGDKGPDSTKIAEEITYPRIKTVITGVRQDGSKYSDGIPANLRYYKINHREKKPSIDANRQDIVTYMENIIQVKENAYKQLEVNEDFAIYESNEKYVGLVFEPFSLEEAITDLKERNKEKRPAKLYVFSYSRDAFEDDYGADFEIEFVAMPEGLLKTYAHIVEEQKKEDL